MVERESDGRHGDLGGQASTAMFGSGVDADLGAVGDDAAGQGLSWR